MQPRRDVISRRPSPRTAGLSYMSFDRDGDAGTAKALEDALTALSFKDDLMVIDAKFHLIGVEPIVSDHGARSAPEAGQRSGVHVSSPRQACLSAISSSLLALRSHENS
jgi:hypothetical protein